MSKCNRLKCLKKILLSQLTFEDLVPASQILILKTTIQPYRPNFKLASDSWWLRSQSSGVSYSFPHCPAPSPHSGISFIKFLRDYSGPPTQDVEKISGAGNTKLGASSRSAIHSLKCLGVSKPLDFSSLYLHAWDMRKDQMLSKVSSCSEVT